MHVRRPAETDREPDGRIGQHAQHDPAERGDTNDLFLRKTIGVAGNPDDRAGRERRNRRHRGRRNAESGRGRCGHSGDAGHAGYEKRCRRVARIRVENGGHAGETQGCRTERTDRRRNRNSPHPGRRGRRDGLPAVPGSADRRTERPNMLVERIRPDRLPYDAVRPEQRIRHPQRARTADGYRTTGCSRENRLSLASDFVNRETMEWLSGIAVAPGVWMEQNYAFVPLDVLTETVTTVSETLSQLQLTVRKSAREIYQHQ